MLDFCTSKPKLFKICKVFSSLVFCKLFSLKYILLISELIILSLKYFKESTIFAGGSIEKMCASTAPLAILINNKTESQDEMKSHCSSQHVQKSKSRPRLQTKFGIRSSVRLDSSHTNTGVVRRGLLLFRKRVGGHLFHRTA